MQTELKRVTDIANTKEAQRAKLEDQVNQLNRRVADQQTKNAGMFKIANEILVRYERFGLGDALTAREPFTGITRVKLQSLFEDGKITYHRTDSTSLSAEAVADARNRRDGRAIEVIAAKAPCDVLIGVQGVRGRPLATAIEPGEAAAGK